MTQAKGKAEKKAEAGDEGQPADAEAAMLPVETAEQDRSQMVDRLVVEFDRVLDDLREVVAGAAPARVKVILETGLLSDEEKVKACVLARRAGADFVKTSTGFGKGGATAGDIALMRRVVGSAMGVKASGGIRTYADVVKMISAGATRVGCSSSVKIMEEALVLAGRRP